MRRSVLCCRRQKSLLESGSAEEEQQRRVRSERWHFGKCELGVQIWNRNPCSAAIPSGSLHMQVYQHCCRLSHSDGDVCDKWCSHASVQVQAPPAVVTQTPDGTCRCSQKLGKQQSCSSQVYLDQTKRRRSAYRLDSEVVGITRSAHFASW